MVPTDKNIEHVKRKLELSPQRSTRSLARELHLSQSSVWSISREELKKYPYRIQMKEKQTTENEDQRVHFADKIASNLEDTLAFLNNVLFSDEAHFELSGYGNRQNMRIWSDENPHDTVEAPR